MRAGTIEGRISIVLVILVTSACGWGGLSACSRAGPGTLVGTPTLISVPGSVVTQTPTKTPTGTLIPTSMPATPVCEQQLVVVTPQAIDLMPVDHIKGDKDFFGRVEVELRTELVQDGTTLVAKIFMRAEEPKGDHTTVQGSTEVTLYRASQVGSNWKIQRISHPAQLKDSCKIGTDTIWPKKDPITIQRGLAGPVIEYHVWTDRIGRDVGCYTRLRVHLNEIRLLLVEDERKTGCIPPDSTPTPTPRPTSTSTPAPTATLTLTPTSTPVPTVTPATVSTPTPGDGFSARSVLFLSICVIVSIVLFCFIIMILILRSVISFGDVYLIPRDRQKITRLLLGVINPLRELAGKLPIWIVPPDLSESDMLYYAGQVFLKIQQSLDKYSVPLKDKSSMKRELRGTLEKMRDALEELYERREAIKLFEQNPLGNTAQDVREMQQYEGQVKGFLEGASRALQSIFVSLSGVERAAVPGSRDELLTELREASRRLRELAESYDQVKKRDWPIDDRSSDETAPPQG